MEGEPPRQGGTASKTDGTYGYGARLLRLPPFLQINSLTEDCQSGLLAHLGKVMGVTATKVQILHLPPVTGDTDELEL
jgi:hypothetical protein